MRYARWSVIAAAVAVALAPTPAWLVERWFSGAWYPALQPRLTAFSDLFPFALFDLFCACTAIGLVAWWRRGLRGRPRALRWRAAGWLTFDTLTVAAVIYLWFLAVWGLNYRREKITARLDFDERRVTRAALVALASDAARQATAERERAQPPSADPDLLAHLAPPFADTLAALSAGHARPSRPKWSVFALLWKRTGVDGMTDPFFLESLVRTDLLPFERPFVIAHEWAHLAGFADESEASFISYLTCVRGDADARYSAWLLMYGQVARELGDADRAAVQKLLGPGPLADLRALAEKTRREVVPLARHAGRAVYDRFLKANRLERGVRSYDEVTRLLVGTKMTRPGAPSLRRQ